ncbi:Panacea domain-containing protein [Symbioplanes lichenis]|uniref:Panacea domain-containing protein n=1 Tax=Symbioplanes lichenis TaxID=1629072 RepID=UPI00273A1E65|nr:type II toxin-antitoxin system antitoxin SocA domain-containing protein [Actinoplanes lichenis]
MASIHDLIAYLLQKNGPTGSMEVHTLLYYAQAWHLVDDEEPLFADRIEAWPPQPVLPDLFELHADMVGLLDAWPRGDAERLTATEREAIDDALENYGRLSHIHLAALVTSEAPWRDARAGLDPLEISHHPITPAALYKYYSSLATDDDAIPIEAMTEDAWDRLVDRSLGFGVA